MQVTMEWLHWTGQWHKYKHFILLNSSVRGPFYPSYMGSSWQWTRAFTDRLVGNVKLVSSSLVCLPEVDAGGLGPKVYLSLSSSSPTCPTDTIFFGRLRMLCTGHPQDRMRAAQLRRWIEITAQSSAVGPLLHPPVLSMLCPGHKGP